MKDLKSLVIEARTVRRYSEEKKLTEQELFDIVDTARQTATSRNNQLVRFIVAHSKEDCALVKESFRFGGSFAEDKRPQENEVPHGYIILVAPKDLSFYATIDIGIIAQTLQLALTEKGYKGCMIGAFNRPVLEENLKKISYELVNQAGEELIPYLILALGTAKEDVEIREVKANDALAYYREDDTHIVPKICLEDMILKKNS